MFFFRYKENHLIAQLQQEIKHRDQEIRQLHELISREQVETRNLDLKKTEIRDQIVAFRSIIDGFEMFYIYNYLTVQFKFFFLF